MPYVEKGHEIVTSELECMLMFPSKNWGAKNCSHHIYWTVTKNVGANKHEAWVPNLAAFSTLNSSAALGMILTLKMEKKLSYLQFTNTCQETEEAGCILDLPWCFYD